VLLNLAIAQTKSRSQKNFIPYWYCNFRKRHLIERQGFYIRPTKVKYYPLYPTIFPVHAGEFVA